MTMTVWLGEGVIETFTVVAGRWVGGGSEVYGR